jgi:hypothetical protein
LSRRSTAPSRMRLAYALHDAIGRQFYREFPD